jgi:phage terminase small subunit
MKKKQEKEEELTEQQKMFCYEYIKDWNAGNAARRVGYADNSADQQASRMLKKDKIKKFIDGIIKETLGDEIESTKLKVIRELQSIAFADITKDVNLVKHTREDGSEYLTVEFNETKDSENKKAIASIKATSNGGIEVKYHDKARALELLGRSVTLFVDKIEHSGGMKNTNVNYNDLSEEEAAKVFKENHQELVNNDD